MVKPEAEVFSTLWGLCDQAGKIEAARQMIASKCYQAADIESRLLPLLAAHGTIEFLDPLPNAAFTIIVGSIE
jgi:hypothetical protein